MKNRVLWARCFWHGGLRQRDMARVGHWWQKITARQTLQPALEAASQAEFPIVRTPVRLSPLAIWLSVCAVVFLAWLIIGLTPADAADYQIEGTLEIPEINLSSDVAVITPEDGELPTPASLVGSYQANERTTLLYGHASGVFANLDHLTIGTKFSYDGTDYIITDKETLPKEHIDMSTLLAAHSTKRLILMTCAGTQFANGDATERLILTAQEV